MQSEGGHWQYFASSSFTNALLFFYCSQDGGGRDCYLVAEGGQLLMVWFAVVLTSCLFTVHGVPPYMQFPAPAVCVWQHSGGQLEKLATNTPTASTSTKPALMLGEPCCC